MKIGDMIRIKLTGKVGLIVEKIRKCVPDGNPSGDFNIEYHYRVSCNDGFVVIPQRNFFRVAEVISESR